MKTATKAISIILHVMIFNSSYAIPPNAHASGNEWKCNSGYKQKGHQCEKLSASESQSINKKFAIAMSFDREENYKEAFKIYFFMLWAMA